MPFTFVFCHGKLHCAGIVYASARSLLATWISVHPLQLALAPFITANMDPPLLFIRAQGVIDASFLVPTKHRMYTTV